ncbi:ImmA/IrrE family metallo-endopeptidase [Virgibacillus kimchii]
MPYENLLKEAQQQGIDIYEIPMLPRNKGLYSDNVIWINKYIETSKEKASTLAEELGHHYTSAGDIIDQTNLNNRKQEKKARSWAYEKLVPLEKIIQAHELYIESKYEFADHLGITESFLDSALERYKEKFGATVNFDDYIISFEPLGVIKWFED